MSLFRGQLQGALNYKVLYDHSVIFRTFYKKRKKKVLWEYIFQKRGKRKNGK